MIGPFVLLAVLVVAVQTWGRRSKAADAAGERKARELHTDETAQRNTLAGEQPRRASGRR